MKPGEIVKVKIEYDLFGLNIKSLEGIFIKILSNDKCLIYYEQNGEWAEVSQEDLEKNKKSYVSKKNKEFVSRIKTLEYSC